MDKAITPAAERNYAFFQHRKCEFFPCHTGVLEEEFNCLFCYCPLYAMGKDCGGNPVFLENGVKSCEMCVFPHMRENYDALLARLIGGQK